MKLKVLSLLTICYLTGLWLPYIPRCCLSLFKFKNQRSMLKKEYKNTKMQQAGNICQWICRAYHSLMPSYSQVLNRQSKKSVRHIFTWEIYCPKEEVFMVYLWSKCIPCYVLFNKYIYCPPEILQVENILGVHFKIQFLLI